MQIILPEYIDQAKTSIVSIGGKALNLWKMQKQGFPVPNFCIIPAETIDILLMPLKADIERICRGLHDKKDGEIIDFANDIQRQMDALTLPTAFINAVQGVCTNRFGANFSVAVRSSAISEDGSKTSFAGQHASFLCITEKELGACILKTIASSWSLNALKYRILHGLTLNDIKIAVVIQQMVDAQKSGVGFSMNLKGNMADMLLVAGYGLGEGIVADKVESDTYTVNRLGNSIEKEVVRKETSLVHCPQKGIVQMPVQNGLALASVLNDAQILEVCGYMSKAEKLLKAPADIEFSFDAKGKLYLLQMRPITTLERDKIKILDNTNIVESYPSITLPLTFSFVSQAYAKVFMGSSKAFMIPEKTIDAYADVFDNLLMHFKGRIYYRLDNWYRMVALVHNSRKSMEAWENAVGLSESASDKVNFSFRGKIRTLLSSLKLILNYKQGNAEFFKLFYQNYALLKDFQKHSTSPSKLWHHYELNTTRLFKPWYLTIVNDFIAFKAFGWLQDLLKTYKISEDGALANDLLCGIGGIDSEEAIIQVLTLKEQIKNNPALTALFEQSPPNILRGLKQEKFNGIYEQIGRYLEKYGDRTLAELKLETKSLRTHPDLFIGLLKNQLGSSATADDFRKTQNEIKIHAENQVQTHLKWRLPKKIVFNIVLKWARYGLKSRENMRFCRTRGYSAVKDIFLEIGKMMVDEQIIHEAEDVFYLQLSDLKAFCLNEDKECKIDLINDLKEQFQAYHALNLPDRIIYMDDDLPFFDNKTNETTNETMCFKGIAVSKGIIVAEAIVITEPKLDMDVRGKILVSKMTDPGWIFLMSQAAGLVSEKGSLLSHTAIVGRELGIPVVVGVVGATSIFKTGDVLRLDGHAGTVDIQHV